MKKLIYLILVVLSVNISYSQKQENPEFAGDNFSLEGALVMFKRSSSLDEFEKLINEESNNVNNLDLNKDDVIDYINVEDVMENNVHAIVLSTYLSETDKQDIAVIGIEKTGNEEATLQIEGDEELYATNSIVEPFDIDEKVYKPSKGGPSVIDIDIKRIIVNVWFWPCVRYIYAPNYVVFISPHRWGLFPKWYRTWRPFRYQIFYSNCSPHRVYYHKTTMRRVVVARKVYAPRRKTTTIVVRNRRDGIINQKSIYRNENRRVIREKSEKRNSNSHVKIRKENKGRR